MMSVSWCGVLGLTLLLSQARGHYIVDRQLGSEGEVRLAGGEKNEESWYGRVEIHHDGQWGTVCSDGVNDLDVQIICKGLGYGDGYRTGIVTPGTGPIWMSQVNCQRQAESLAECDHNGWANTRCTHHQDVGVMCVNPFYVPPDPNNPREADVRLVDGEKTDMEWSGRVEIYHAGQWGTVCNFGAGYEDQWTICKGLGYDDVSSERGIPPGSGPIWLGALTCTGASRLSECHHTGWGNSGCTHQQDLAVRCVYYPDNWIGVNEIDGNRV